MQNGRTLSKPQIRKLIERRKSFKVATNDERHDVLIYAAYVPVKLQTKAREEGGYSVTFTV